MPAKKMQENQIESIRLCVYLGFILPRMTTNFLVVGGHSPNTTSERTTDGPMGSSDAKGRGRSTDVLETETLRLALPTTDCHGGLALLWNKFYW